MVSLSWDCKCSTFMPQEKLCLHLKPLGIITCQGGRLCHRGQHSWLEEGKGSPICLQWHEKFSGAKEWSSSWNVTVSRAAGCTLGRERQAATTYGTSFHRERLLRNVFEGSKYWVPHFMRRGGFLLCRWMSISQVSCKVWRTACDVLAAQAIKTRWFELHETRKKCSIYWTTLKKLSRTAYTTTYLSD